MTKGRDTRGTILSAALAQASEIGLGALSIGGLAERVGMSKSGLFAHFGSKEDLQVAVLDDAVERFIALVIAPALKEPRGEPRVRALFERWLVWSKQDFQPGGCIFLAASAELDDQPGPARDRLVASQRDWLEVLAGAARIAVEEGHFRRGLDAQQFAFELYAIALGLHQYVRLMRDGKAEKRARAAFGRLLADARADGRATHD